MSTETVKVMVRCRPMNRRQKQLECQIVVNVDTKQNQINLYKPDSKEAPKPFTFDHVFGMDSLQSYVYEQTAFSLVDNVIQGYNGTIFAYGQTGCGKTHTMMGSNQSDEMKGIIPRTFNQIITFTSNEKDKKHLVQCSFIEIYNQQIHDLLGKNTKAKMDLKESPNKGVYVKDLTMNIVKTSAEMEKFMEAGFKNRAVRETAMNKESSRSHSIFTIHIQTQETNQIGEEKFKAGKLNLVDLAGSQRQSKTHAVGDGMKEAAKINLSLSALGNVISALVDGKTHHIPYRDSKLTRLLQDSLGGNTKTIMIAAVSPASDNYEETLSTLRYANRAKSIKNKPIINEDPKDALLRQYAEEIKNLKMMLEGKMPMDMNALNLHQQKMGGNGEQIKYVEVYKNGEANSNNHELQSELQSKEEKLRNQQQEKEKLKEQLANLQNLIGHDNSPTDKKQLERMKKLKQKLKQQKKKEEEYMNERKQREEELFTMEKSYKSLNQEVEEMRIRFQQIKKKYLVTLQELNDIRQQHQTEKQELLDTIRLQQAEIGKYSGICSMILTQDQIQQIVSQSEYDDETKEWTIAPFYYRQKNVNFPKLGQIKSAELIEHQKQKKQLTFKDFGRKQEITKIKGTYRISDVVRNARQQNQLVQSHNLASQKKMKHPNSSTNLQFAHSLNKNQLSPIKDSTQRLRSIDDESSNGSALLTHNKNNTKIKLNPISNGGGGFPPPKSRHEESGLR